MSAQKTKTTRSKTGGKAAVITLKRMALTDCKPHPRNPRKHPDAGSPEWNALKASLEHDYFDPIILNKRNGFLVSGHLRCKVLTASGFTHADVSVVDYDERTHIARMIAANRLQGADDLPMLKDAFAELDTGADFDLQLTGWTEDQIGELMLQEHQSDAPEAQMDKAAELQKIWKVKRGDLWRIGEHRLLCGDSTSKADVARVMGGDLARLVATDPPYGVKYGDKLDAANPVMHGVRGIQNDSLTAGQTEDLWRRAFSEASNVCVPGGAIYAAAAAAGDMLLASMKAFDGSGFTFKWQLVWVKDQIVLGRGDYHFKHENILYGWKENAAHFFIDDRTQTSVFEYARPKFSDEHPTMKPPELYCHLIRNSTEPSAIVFDPFTGSGTTLLACEQLKRRGRGIEIEPKYVSVTLERLKTMGLKPEKIT